jgi:hypothetical protein
MRRHALILILFAAAFVPSMAEAQCTPGGWTYVTFGAFYNHIANGGPTFDGCWERSDARTAFVQDNACDFFPYAYKFGYAGSISQVVTVPSNMTQTHWELDYKLDFTDPNNDPYWNRISVTVRDLTTGTVLATDNYSSLSGSSLTCATRRLPFAGNFAGRQLVVNFNGTTAYSNSIIKVRRIELWQW